MSNRLKLLLVVVLCVLMVASGGLFIFSVTRPSAAYDPSKVRLDVKLLTRNEILTCAYKVYGDNNQDMWVAKTIIKNVGKMPARNFKISYKVGDLTEWNSGETYAEIRPGQTVRDYCFPPLNQQKVEAITTKTPVELTVRYDYDGLKEAEEESEKLFLLGKNDFVFTSLKEADIITFADNFDNYRFIAAFITPNEETTKAFANAAAGGLETRATDEDAIAAFESAFEALRTHGVKYIMEPSGFWTGGASQYVQYPKETIERNSGTCLDLAITMSAMMEAVGVKSYVALIPGHAIPVIETPQSGDTYAIESTFLDKDYAVSKHGDVVSPDVTASECISLAKQELEKAQDDGTIIYINPEFWWKEGVMPSW
ncbi:MAG TPA: hypothetical protein VIK15_01740 [Candidatus Anoxymicrobiaceae bacterium]